MKAILTKTALILVFFLALSCGARKSEKSRTSETTKNETAVVNDIEKKEEATVKVVEKKTVDSKTKTKTTETSYKPVDPNKEASVTTPDGKKHTLNNAEVVVKETEQDQETTTDASMNSETTNKTELKDQSKSKAKAAIKKEDEEIHIDRKAWNPLWLFWLLIPIGIVLFLLNKNKDKIWWI